MGLKVKKTGNVAVSIFLIPAVLLIAAPEAFASVSVSYQISPNILMPGDNADGILTISNPNAYDVEVNSVVFYGNGIAITPRSIYNIGTLPPGATYTLPFSVKALKVGRYDVEAIVSTKNEDVIQHMEVVVDNNFPSITVSSPVYRNEVNSLKFYISSPVPLSNVIVIPLFNSKPKEIYVGNVEGEGTGEVKFIPGNEKYLKFRISFYTGRNYHEVTKSVPISLVESKGVVVNASSPSSAFIGDCIEIKVEAFNLRHDAIYKARVNVETEKGMVDSKINLPKIDGGESKRFTLLYTPVENGKDVVKICLEFQDEFGNSNSSCGEVLVNVSEDYVISITNLEIKRDFEGTHISGDVSNNGWSEVMNAYVTAVSGKEKADYFLGNIEPSDFQSFDLTVKSNGTVKLTVEWMNKAGREFKMEKELSTEKFVEKVPEEGASTALTISVTAAILIVLIVSLVIYRYLRRS